MSDVSIGDIVLYSVNDKREVPGIVNFVHDEKEGQVQITIFHKNGTIENVPSKVFMISKDPAKQMKKDGSWRSKPKK